MFLHRSQRATILLIAMLTAANVPATAQRPAPPPIEGVTVAGPGAPSSDEGTWPQFRGPARDAVVPAAKAEGLLRDWPAGGPEVLWTLDGLYMGYSGPAVHGGRVYFNDYDEQGTPDAPGPRWMIRCVSLADGQEIWRWSYQQLIRPNHAVTRTVPATDGRVVVSLDPKAVLHAFDTATGQRLWGYHLPAVYRSRIPPWYNGQCPLFDEGRVVIGIGGLDVLMAAFDPVTGEELWRTPNASRHPLSHSSVAPAVIGGRRQYLWLTLRGMVGVDAADGTLLWEALWRAPGDTAATRAAEAAAGQANVSVVDWRANTAIAPSPVVLDDGRIFITAGYRAGSAMLRVTVDEHGIYTADVEYALTHEQFYSDCQTPVRIGDHLYAVDHAAASAGRLACLALDGSLVWRHDGAGFGLGPWIVVGDTIFILEGDTGVLRMVKASPEGYRELGAAHVLRGHEAWAPMAYADGKLLLRNLDKMICLQVAE